jgi:hypothetical protein
VPAAEPAVLARGRSALLATAPPRRHRFRITLPRLAIGSGGLIAAATATAVGLSLAAAGGTATAATVLTRAAAHAGAEPAMAVHPGQYTFTEYVSHNPGNPVQREQDWRPVDGNGAGRIQFSFGTEPWQILQVAGPPCADSAPVHCIASPAIAGWPTYDYLASLPTDPVKLKKIVYTQAAEALKTFPGSPGYNLDTQAFYLISGALMHSVAPPKVRAALLEVAARIPGTTVVNDVVDAAGRHGVGVRGGGDTVNQTTLVFDKDTYQVLGENLHSERGDEAVALVRSGIVDRIGDLP